MTDIGLPPLLECVLFEEAQRNGSFCSERKEVTDHAFTPSVDGFSRSGRPALASQRLHTNGRIDQIDPECSCSHRGSVVAHEYFWSFAFSLADSRWLSA